MNFINFKWSEGTCHYLSCSLLYWNFILLISCILYLQKRLAHNPFLVLRVRDSLFFNDEARYGHLGGYPVRPDVHLCYLSTNFTKDGRIILCTKIKSHISYYVFLGRDSQPLRHKVVFSCSKCLKLWFWRPKLLQWVLSVTLPGLSASFASCKKWKCFQFSFCVLFPFIMFPVAKTKL